MFILSFENYTVESTFGSIYENEYAHRNCAITVQNLPHERKKRTNSRSKIYVCRLFFCFSYVGGSLLWTRSPVHSVSIPEHALDFGSVHRCSVHVYCFTSCNAIMVILLLFRFSVLTKRKDKNAEVEAMTKKPVLHFAFVKVLAHEIRANPLINLLSKSVYVCSMCIENSKSSNHVYATLSTGWTKKCPANETFRLPSLKNHFGNILVSASTKCMLFLF